MHSSAVMRVHGSSGSRGGVFTCVRRVYEIAICESTNRHNTTHRMTPICRSAVVYSAMLQDTSGAEPDKTHTCIAGTTRTHPQTVL